MTPELRVLHVLEAVRGGTSRHVADVVDHAPGIRHHVAVPPPDRPGGPAGGAPYDQAAVARMLDAGAVVHQVDMRRQPWHPVNGRALLRLRTLVDRVQPAVVHGHSSVGGALARVVGRTSRRPVVYTPNGVATGRLYQSLERGLGALTDRWVAVSESEASAALARGLTDARRLAVIPNGIDLTPPGPGPDLRARLGIAAGTPLVGTIARLVPQKAPGTFVRMAAAVGAGDPAPHFLLIGMGPLQGEVDTEVARAGLGGRWHQIEHLEAAAGVLGQLDVFVLASAFEGGPYTPLEAMRAGVPVVLTDVVGSRDAVEPGVSGFLCPPGDAAGLAAAVQRLLGDPDLRRSVAAAASARLASMFDVEKMGAELADLYLALVTPRPAA